MAYGRTLAHRFLDAAKSLSAQIRSGAGWPSVQGSVLRRFLPDSGNRGIQWRPIVHAAVPPDRISMPIGIKLFDRISAPNGDQIRRDMLPPPPSLPPISLDAEADKRMAMGMTVEEIKKVLKATQIEMVRSKLRAIPKSSVSSSEFLRICSEASSLEQGPELARSLDKSGAVIVLGNVVFLRPDQIAKAIESAIPLSASPVNVLPRKKEEELRELEGKKAMIDKEAKNRARRELWCGLAFLAVQTGGFMRLTFWDLSWDVMEPICFYVTSFYFMAGYVFFMRTSTDPSFEGFFKSRFSTKQKKLMRAYNFDHCRFNQLKGVCRSSTSSPPSSPVKQVHSSCCDCDRRNALLGSVY